MDEEFSNPMQSCGATQRRKGVRGLRGMRFDIEFGRSMVKMGNTDLKTGSEGEIRRVCTATN
ncbi:heme peroxidase [Cynara cardunculus var. scolymus]|uniref:Heme peroxidase n=1 Tax=Cynara cardunculus var. scolymus TaxID=59895 RepID=A0A103XMF0_CYNCS|nr:heme peroxidase [Cynara cardunculus var. scolymus]